MSKTTTILTILDGWGIGKEDASNPIYASHLPVMESIHRNFPGGKLHASGIMVGLPWDEPGNSEVGHLTIGAGKILYQHFPRISLAINEGNFFSNQALQGAFTHAKNNNTTVHLVGLLSEGNVHASLSHLTALIEMAKRESCASLSLHLFSDGVDSGPKNILPLLSKIQDLLKGTGVISSVMGRYYAMNRDEQWKRTETAYRLLIGKEGLQDPIEETAEKAYKHNLSDEFIEPTMLPNGKYVEDNDALIFFNFREDSMKQITEPFLNPSFIHFPTAPLKNLFVATMTQYHSSWNAHVAFPPETADRPLGKVLAENGKTQLRIAETEKYAHVTYFFNGLKNEPFQNEYRILIPSENISHHELRPEMMARAITDRALSALNEGVYDFILINFANADIIAHTGNFEATIKAVRTIDQCVERLQKGSLEGGHSLIITADHGNAEALLNPFSGEVETKHDPNPVPFYLVDSRYKKRKGEEEFYHLPTIGMLSDIAPTILELMDIPKPNHMTGQSLIEQLR